MSDQLKASKILVTLKSDQDCIGHLLGHLFGHPVIVCFYYIFIKPYIKVTEVTEVTKKTTIYSNLRIFV